MMPRPVWTGTISFGLVAIPVKLFHAVREQSVSFNQLDDRTMARIKYKKVSALDGEEVPEEHIVKGYEVSKDRYVVVDPDELEPFIPSATKTVELEEFVDLDEIDPVYFDSAYYVAPGTTPKPYVLLARAMEESGKVGIGRFVMRNKQYIAAIRAEDGRLLMSTLAYADEVVDPAEIDELQGLDDVDVSSKEVTMAESLVESLTAAFEPQKYRDEYREQVLDLIQIKASGEEFTAARGRGREAQGGRSHGRARGERARREGRPRPPPRRQGRGRSAGREAGEEGAPRRRPTKPVKKAAAKKAAAAAPKRKSA